MPMTKKRTVVKSSSKRSNFNSVENNELTFVINGDNFADIIRSQFLCILGTCPLTHFVDIKANAI